MQYSGEIIRSFRCPLGSIIREYIIIPFSIKGNLPIRSSEMGMLIYLVKADGEKTAKGVADFFKVTKAMATNMSSALLKNGFLEKQQQENDKRSCLLRPTEKAVQLVNETYDEYMKQMNILRNSMGEAAFHTLLDLLNMANVILLEEKNNG